MEAICQCPAVLPQPPAPPGHKGTATHPNLTVELFLCEVTHTGEASGCWHCSYPQRFSQGEESNLQSSEHLSEGHITTCGTRVDNRSSNLAAGLSSELSGSVLKSSSVQKHHPSSGLWAGLQQLRMLLTAAPPPDPLQGFSFSPLQPRRAQPARGQARQHH